MRAYLALLTLSFASFAATLRADSPPTMIVEKVPTSVFWSKAGTTWILATLFEQAEIKTFFNAPPPDKGVGISQGYVPVKQEFLYRPTGQHFTTENCRYIQHLDGVKSWGFSYDSTFQLDNKTYGNICVIIAEKPEFDIFYIIAQLKDN